MALCAPSRSQRLSTKKGGRAVFCGRLGARRDRAEKETATWCLPQLGPRHVRQRVQRDGIDDLGDDVGHSQTGQDGQATDRRYTVGEGPAEEGRRLGGRGHDCVGAGWLAMGRRLRPGTGAEGEKSATECCS